MDMNNVRTLNGYRVIYRPDCSSSMKNENWKGWIYEHIFVAQENIGRMLSPQEEVHHLDFDKFNNCPSNLIVLTKSDHAKLHKWLEFQGVDKKNIKITEKYFCHICSIPINHKNKYCSKECYAKGATAKSKMANVGLEEVLSKLATRPMSSVCKDYKISDNGLKKWVNKYQAKFKT